MVFKMTRPSKRSGTKNAQYTGRIPADVIRILDGLPASYRLKGWGKDRITISTGTSDRRAAAVQFSRISAEVEERYAQLRAGLHSLTQKQTVALAGTIYKGLTEAMEDNPGKSEMWSGVLMENLLARAGKLGTGPLLIGAEAKRKASMEIRFGRMTDDVLAREGLIVDEPSRIRVMEQVAFALDQAAIRLQSNAEGDYRPDSVAERFPVWENPASPAARKKTAKLPLMKFFEEWAEHPEQQEQARRTVLKYRAVFKALDEFLKHPEAPSVAVADIRRFTDHRMVELGNAPRTVRDVYKAAISSVFNWGVGKGRVAINPAAGVAIKVKKMVSLRSKELTDAESSALVAQCLGVPVDSAAKSIDAARRWCPMICMYTGARIGEVAQLRVEDVRFEDGIHFLRITPDAGTVKNRKYRDVPLHARLLEVGLLEFVRKAGDGPLFYDPAKRRQVRGGRADEVKAPQTEVVAAGIVEWVRKKSLPDPELKKPLHGIRHRFITVARQMGIDPQYIEAITGHVATGQNSQYGSFDRRTLARELGKLEPASVEGRPSP
jgi:integrase